MEVTASRPSHGQRGARVLVPSLPAPRVGSTRTVKNGVGGPVRAISMQSETGAAHGHSTSTPVKTKPGPVRTCLCYKRRVAGVTELESRRASAGGPGGGAAPSCYGPVWRSAEVGDSALTDTFSV